MKIPIKSHDPTAQFAYHFGGVWVTDIDASEPFFRREIGHTRRPDETDNILVAYKDLVPWLYPGEQPKIGDVVYINSSLFIVVDASAEIDCFIIKRATPGNWAKYRRVNLWNRAVHSALQWLYNRGWLTPLPDRGQYISRRAMLWGRVTIEW